jgi:beta-galactosidase/beta-glucuronidase
LDQGYFPDGLFTPATPAAYTNDVLEMKRLGFNTLRKHIKIEPESFYYDCDRLGMVVFQDMVNNGDYNFIRDTALPTVGVKRLCDKNMHKDKKARAQFELEMEKTVSRLYNHPSICYWTIFNEGWGQFCSTQMYHKLKKLDGSRIIDSTSGWFWGGETDVKSEHVYFKKYKFKKDSKPVVLSEFGGYCLREEGHTFNLDCEYGYKTLKTRRELQDAIITLYERDVIPAIKNGLCASVYTQVSDVEDEINGILTYDRKICKLNGGTMRKLAEKIYNEIV